MTTITSTLAVIGAAEGSWYANKDLRYTPSFANANSGLSFGTFQFDVAVNIEGQNVFRAILAKAVTARTIDQTASTRLYAGACKRNAKVYVAANDITIIANLLNTTAARQVIDGADQIRAQRVSQTIDGMISTAAQVWAAKGVTAAILTPGGAGNLQLFAYLLASWNRRPDNQQTFQKWLGGQVVQTLHAPAGGFQLTAPPTIEDMHTFFKSLKIWDGTQGNYQYLRDRMDPVLTRMAGAGFLSATPVRRGASGTW